MEADDIAQGRVPSMDDMLKAIMNDDANATEGIASPAHIGEMVQRQFTDTQEAITKEARLFANVLWRDENGRKLLEELLNLTLRAPTWPMWEVRDPQMLLMHGIGREYQNELMRGILRAIATALEAERHNTGEEDDDD